MSTLVYTKVDIEHPQCLVSFRVMGFSIADHETLRLIKGMGYLKNTSTYVASLDTVRVVTKRFNCNVQYLNNIANEIKEYESRADIEVHFVPSSKRISVRFNQRKISGVPFPWDFESFSYLASTNGFTITSLEATRLPEYFHRFYDSFTVRYDKGASDYIQSEVSRAQKMAELGKAEDCPELKDLLSFLPFESKPYQRAAVACALEAAKYDTGYIQSLDTGLGKTAVAIMISKLLNDKKVLWVTKASLMMNLEEEIHKLSGESSYRLVGITPSVEQVQEMISGNHKHYIINYEIIGRWKEDKNRSGEIEHSIQPWVFALNMIKFDRVIMDEAHKIKNMDSQRSVACRNLNIKSPLLLTATPMPNRPKELFPLLNIVLRSKYNSYAGFTKVHGDGNYIINGDKLKDDLATIMFRRLKTDVEKELPPVIEIPFYTEIEESYKIRYKKALRDLFVDSRGRESSITAQIAQLNRLIQIIAEGKADATIDLALETQEETGQKVLIFSFFKDVLHKVAQTLNCHYLDGTITGEERQKIARDFQTNPNTKFLALQIDVAGEGLTLTQAHTVIFNDQRWNNATHIQAIGRAWGRLNDMHGCNAYYMMTKDTVDQHMESLRREKADTELEVIDGIKVHSRSDASAVSRLLESLKADTW